MEADPRPPRVASRPLGATLRRHVRRQLVAPLLLCLGAFTLAILIADLVTFSDLIVNRGFGAAEVARIALFRLLPVFGYTMPFALLISALAMLGRMTADGELLFLESSGISPLRLARPVFGFGLALTAASLGVSLLVTPRTNAALNQALSSVAEERPTAALQPGVVAAFGDWRLQAREVSSDGKRLRGVAVWVPELGETAFARSGRFTAGNGGPAKVRLEDGVLLFGADREPSQVRFGAFEREVTTDAGGASVVDPWAALPTAELWRGIQDESERGRRRVLQAELQRRLTLPAAAALFALLAVPLGLSRRTATRSGGVLIGVGVTVAYYALVQLGEGLARSPELPVALAMWLPNALLLALALALVLRFRMQRSREIGGRSVGRAARGRRSRTRRGPLRTLDRYVLLRFLELALLCTGLFLLASLLVDVLDNVKWFTRYQSTLSEVLRYYGARVPILASRVLPIALVAAAALTMGLLSATGELVAMRSCGVSPSRTAAPILMTCVGFACFYHVLANEWVPKASARASRIKQLEIKNRSATRRDVWYRAGDQLYAIDRIDPLRGVADGITVYRLDGDGLPSHLTHAAQARHLGDGLWQLADAQSMEISPARIVVVPAEAYAQLGNDVPSEVDTGDLDLGALMREIEEARAGGYDPRRFLVDLHLRLAEPLACFLLPALALAFAVTGPPFPTVVQMLVVSLVLTLAHVVLRAVGAALGYGGVLPPPLAGWAPLAAIALGGAWLGRSVRSRAPRS